jgi:hypothetical protein
MWFYLNKDLNAENYLILWVKNDRYFTLVTDNTLCLSIVSYLYLVAHIHVLA